MPHHLLGLPFEIRMLIWENSLYGVRDVVNVWSKYDWDDFVERLYVEKSRWREGSSSKPAHVTSLLCSCRQICAEAMPIFHQHVPLYFRSFPWYMVSPPPMPSVGLEVFEMRHFDRACRNVQSVILPDDLGMVRSIANDEARTFFSNLPNLRTLTIYESCDAWDLRVGFEALSSKVYGSGVAKETSIAKQRQSAMDFINDYHSQPPQYGTLDHSWLFDGRRDFTLIHQGFVNSTEVCVSVHIAWHANLAHSFVLRQCYQLRQISHSPSAREVTPLSNWNRKMSGGSAKGVRDMRLGRNT
jgi:hypothetical protein